MCDYSGRHDVENLVDIQVRQQVDFAVHSYHGYSMQDHPWYCLKCHPKREHIAEAHLEKNPDVSVYNPRIQYTKATATGARIYKEALFPGYLFAAFNYADRSRFILSRPGVSSVVRFGDAPVPTVDQEFIDGLRAFFRPKEVITVPQKLEPGQEVALITRGFEGTRALIEEVLPTKQRVVLLLTILGEVRRIETDQSVVLSVAEPRQRTDF